MALGSVFELTFICDLENLAVLKFLGACIQLGVELLDLLVHACYVFGFSAIKCRAPKRMRHVQFSELHVLIRATWDEMQE